LENNFSENIMRLRYSWDKENGEKETWDEINERAFSNIFSIVDFPNKKEKLNKMLQYAKERKFILGGRFLAQSGKEYHQTNNCFLLRAEDTREGWGELLNKASVMLMSGGGIGIDYSLLRPKGSPLKRSGGTSSGAVPLMKMINEVGRGVMAGGNRRSAIWAGLVWDHGDIFDFIECKNWIQEVRDLKEKDFDFPASMDMTNVSVILDKRFFDAYENESDPKHELAKKIYWKTIERMLKTGEPGFSINYDNPNESLRNACFTGDMNLLTDKGYQNLIELEKNLEVEIIDSNGSIQKGRVFSNGIKDIIKIRLSNKEIFTCTPDHIFLTNFNEEVQAKDLKGKKLKPYLKYKKLNDEYILYGFIQGDGNLTRLNSNAHKGLEINIGSKDQDIIELLQDREYTRNKRKYTFYLQNENEKLINLGFSSLVLPERIFPSTYHKWNNVNKASFLRGCFSANGTINNHGRICYKSTSKEFIYQLKETLEKEFNISSYITTNKVKDVKFSNGTYTIKESYDLNISKYSEKIKFYNEINFYQKHKIELLTKIMYEKSPFVTSIKENGTQEVFDFSIFGKDHFGVINNYLVHNCTEISSEDDCDVCCLGSINLGQVESIEELIEITELSQLTLLIGTEYSDAPYPKVKEIRDKNRRTGLGLMGIHEWLIKRGYRYEQNEELTKWLTTWQETSDFYAEHYAKILGFNIPIKKRAIAPNGSTSIAGGKTTGGLEPVMSIAYQRRYLTPSGWKKQFVIDFVAERLYEEGYDVSKMEDAYTLSLDPERRIAFQAYLQNFVDNGISSTINLPAFGSIGNNDIEGFGKILYKYLPKLRGITVYPDRARGGQPITPVDFKYALQRKNLVFEGNENCENGICGL